MTALRFRLLPYPAEADAIREAFAALDATLGGTSLYQTHAWFRHNVDGTQPPGCRGVRVLLIEQAGSVAGAIPLTWLPSRIGRLELQSLVVPWHRGEASAIQLVPGVDFAQSLPGIRRFLSQEWPGWDALSWPKQLPLSGARLPEGASLSRRTVSLPTGSSLTIPVSDDPGGFIAGLSVKARAGLRNARNRLKGHAVEYRVQEAPGAAMAEALEAFLTLEGAGWKQLSDARWPLFRALMSELSAAGRFRIHQMLIDSHLAASLLAVDGPPGRVSVYKISYDEAQARLSPGRLLVYHVVEDASRRGHRVLDMMSAASWLAPWNPVPDPLRTLWCFAPTPRGLSGFLAMAAWSLVRPLVRRIRRRADP